VIKYKTGEGIALATLRGGQVSTHTPTGKAKKLAEKISK